MIDDRAAVLARVREALRVPAPRHDEQDHVLATTVSLPQYDPRPWLPPVGTNIEDRLHLFRRNSLELKTSFVVVESQSAARVELCRLAAAERWVSIATHGGRLSTAIVEGLQLPTLNTETGYSIADLEKVDAGISQCDALVAQTGSVVLTSRTAGGRALSVLPPHHVVIATIDQLLPDLPAAYALIGEKYRENPPSLITMITGPSRTADIERTIVLGAHGPKQLTVILIR